MPCLEEVEVEVEAGAGAGADWLIEAVAERVREADGIELLIDGLIDWLADGLVNLEQEFKILLLAIIHRLVGWVGEKVRREQ